MTKDVIPSERSDEESSSLSRLWAVWNNLGESVRLARRAAFLGRMNNPAKFFRGDLSHSIDSRRVRKR
jgi:hypothetical protein